MRNTSHKGYIAETSVLRELVKHGFNVSIPFGNYRYDIVAEKDGYFNRIQVKYIDWITKRKTVQVNLHSMTRNGRKKYEASDVDFFIAYHQTLERFYVIPFRDFQNQITIQLRLTKPVNNQHAKITFAETYENRWDLLMAPEGSPITPMSIKN